MRMASVTEIYEKRVADGRLERDAAQEAALPEFERIRAELATPVRKGLFRKAPEPPKGLYLWGGVGRGKSMLMDLFVETVDVPARRVHFHAFMQEIHAQMHAERKKGTEDVIKPVAKTRRRRRAAAGLRRDADHRHHRCDDRGPPVRTALRGGVCGRDHLEPGAG